MKKTITVCDACGKSVEGPALSVDLKRVEDHIERSEPTKDACSLDCAFQLAADHYTMVTSGSYQRVGAIVRSADRKIVVEMRLCGTDEN